MRSRASSAAQDRSERHQEVQRRDRSRRKQEVKHASASRGTLAKRSISPIIKGPSRSIGGRLRPLFGCAWRTIGWSSQRGPPDICSRTIVASESDTLGGCVSKVSKVARPPGSARWRNPASRSHCAAKRSRRKHYPHGLKCRCCRTTASVTSCATA